MLKYIATNGSHGQEEIFIFPAAIYHDDMAKSLERIPRNTVGLTLRTPISAGFVSPEWKCYGESVSLSLKSRPQDTDLLKMQMQMGLSY